MEPDRVVHGSIPRLRLDRPLNPPFRRCCLGSAGAEVALKSRDPAKAARVAEETGTIPPDLLSREVAREQTFAQLMSLL